MIYLLYNKGDHYTFPAFSDKFAAAASLFMGPQYKTVGDDGRIIVPGFPKEANALCLWEESWKINCLQCAKWFNETYDDFLTLMPLIAPDLLCASFDDFVLGDYIDRQRFYEATENMGIWEIVRYRELWSSSRDEPEDLFTRGRSLARWIREEGPRVRRTPRKL